MVAAIWLSPSLIYKANDANEALKCQNCHTKKRTDLSIPRMVDKSTPGLISNLPEKISRCAARRHPSNLEECSKILTFR